MSPSPREDGRQLSSQPGLSRVLLGFLRASYPHMGRKASMSAPAWAMLSFQAYSLTAVTATKRACTRAS